jgi:hypothetical protein
VTSDFGAWTSTYTRSIFHGIEILLLIIVMKVILDGEENQTLGDPGKRETGERRTRVRGHKALV